MDDKTNKLGDTIMKYYKYNLLILIFIFVTQNSFSQTNDLILNINGHEHSMPLALKDEVEKFYRGIKDSVAAEMIGKSMDDTGADFPSLPPFMSASNCKVLDLSLKNDISSINFSKVSATKLKVKVRIDSNRTKLRTVIYALDLGGWFDKLSYSYKFWADFNMDLIFEVDVLFEDTKILYRVTSAETEVKITNIDASFDNLLTPAEIFQHWLLIALNNRIYPEHNMTLSDFVDKEYTSLDLTRFAGDVVDGADSEIELEAIRKSLPIEISLGEMSNSSILKLNLKLLHGYYSDSGNFSNAFENHTPTEQNILQYAGFSYLEWSKFDKIKKNDLTLSRLVRVDTLVDRLQGMGLNQLRVEAVWSEIVPEIDNIDASLDTASITNEMVDAYVNEIDSLGNWDELEDIINILKANTDIRPVLVIGSGHEGRPPMCSGKTIAPGTLVRGTNASNYKEVPENVYLYWLTLYARAVVNRYSDYIVNWQVETELNAARFTESYDDWWRKGNAWADDASTGFQTDVARTLYNAVKYEAGERLGHTNKVIQQFHVFNLAKRLVDWKDYYDVVGLNVYPHLFHAWPVVGFMTGEFVWAARRILKYLGAQHQYKPVWILETGYGANTTDPPPTDPTENKMHYSYDRQAQYVKEAILSCAANGAEAFNWYLMETNESEEEETEIEKSNNYIGFYDSLGVRKDEGYYAYKNTFSEIRTADKIVLTNKYNEEELEGTFSIVGRMNGIQSGDSVVVNQNENTILRTNSKYLPRPSTPEADTVQHQQWNLDITSYTLNDTINLSVSYETNQIAKFNYTFPLAFDVNVPNHTADEQIKNIRIRDPWLINAIGDYPNKLMPLSSFPDTLSYDLFKNMYPNDLNLSEPYYSIRAPEIVYFEEDMAVFNNWSVIQDAIIDDDPRLSGDIFQKAVIATGDYPHVRANYFENIKVETGNLMFENNQLTLKAIQMLATQDSLLLFSHWKVFDADGVTENPALANVISPSNYNSAVDILNSDIVFRPVYQAVNHIPHTQLSLFKDQVLYIPPGANIQFAENFSIDVYGDLKFDGRSGEEIILSRPKEPVFEMYSLFNYYSNNDYNTYPYTKLERGAFNYVHFKNFGNDVPVFYFSDNYWNSTNSEQEIKFNHCTFDSCDYVLLTDAPGRRVKLTAENCTFFNSNFKNVDANPYFEFKKCVFYDCQLDDNSFAIYKTLYSTFYPSTFGNSNQYYQIVDPCFVYAPNSDFHLNWGSPCIDVDDGTPDLLDVDGSLVDHGAYYYPQLNDSIKTNTTIAGECRIVSDLTVAEGAELTFKPGAKVKLAPDADIFVYGKLTAKGTSDNKITFTSTEDNPTESDYWGRIYFKDTADNSSIIEHCKIEYADFGVYVWASNIDVRYSNIGPVKYYGIMSRYNVANYYYNNIHDCLYGIFLYYGNDYGTSKTKYNDFSNCQRGLFLVKSSPLVVGNEFYNNTYGVYGVTYSSALFGEYEEYGNNSFHDNDYAIRTYSSNVFLGRDMCTENGGRNSFVNSSEYHIYAGNSIIMAEKNWWGMLPPFPDFFYLYNNAMIDYDPVLSSPPLNKTSVSGGSGDQSAFDSTFSTTDSSLTEEEVMANYDPNWPILRRLLYARNLNKLGFPENAAQISNDILKTCPDSAEAYFALDLLWQSGRAYTEEFDSYKSYLDSLSNSEQEKEVYEEAELLLEDYEEEGLAKKLSTYQKFKFPNVAAKSLFRDVIHYLSNNDIKSARASFSIMESSYPEAPATAEARLLLNELEGITENDPVKIPDEYVLLSNYPNPFNPITNIRFGIPAASNIEITIFNILGQKVKTITKTVLNPGFHKVVWNGTNAVNTPLASGLYVYRFRALSAKENTEKYTKTGKLLLLK